MPSLQLGRGGLARQETTKLGRGFRVKASRDSNTWESSTEIGKRRRKEGIRYDILKGFKKRRGVNEKKKRACVGLVHGAMAKKECACLLVALYRTRF